MLKIHNITCDAMYFLAEEGKGFFGLKCVRYFLFSLAAVVYAYILICFWMNRCREPKQPRWFLIIILSVHTLASIFLDGFLFILAKIGVTSMIWLHWLNIPASISFLAAYRYFQICQPMSSFFTFFSTKKLIISFFFIVCGAFIFSSFNELVCNCGNSKIVLIYSVSVFVFLNLFYIFMIFYVVFAYTCINLCMCRSMLQRSIQMRNPHLRRSFSASNFTSLTLSYNTFMTSLSVKRNNENLSGYTSLKNYSIALVIILIIWYCSWLFMVLQIFFTGKDVFAGTYIIYKILSLILHVFYFASNVFIFHLNDEEFRSTVIEPSKFYNLQTLSNLFGKDSVEKLRKPRLQLLS